LLGVAPELPKVYNIDAKFAKTLHSNKDCEKCYIVMTLKRHQIYLKSTAKTINTFLPLIIQQFVSEKN
jgi:hypothetical protein